MNSEFENYLDILCCPRCKSSLRLKTDLLSCEDPNCKRSFPIIKGKPVLIDSDDSLFSPAQSDGETAPFGSDISAKAWKLLSSLAPSISSNLSAQSCLRRFSNLLLGRTDSPIALVIGCGSQGKGIEQVAQKSGIRLINTDLSIDSNAAVVCDAHRLPFRDGTIDGVIAQAVLEHVVDPKLCVDEIHRILDDSGIVYSEMPFMQQVHAGRFDFTRLTHLGHRSLFRSFEEMESGVVAGPGTSLAWSYYYLLKSLGDSRAVNAASFLVAHFTGFWLKYLDRLLLNSKGSLDAASCTYFLGKKSDVALSDKEIIELYRGSQ